MYLLKTADSISASTARTTHPAIRPRLSVQRYYPLMALLLALLLAAAAPSLALQPTERQTAANQSYADSNGILKSLNDPRSYEALTLDNGLQVLLISDPQSDKAAASLDVSVGSGDDPRDRAGLAHFLEHMLFLGTDKYPEADAYQHFISAHGGSHNAFTSFDSTNYFFDIDPGYFQAALDRFSRFFVSPLFNPEYVQREINAVHSEYQSKLQDDSRRHFAVLKQVINPDHPQSKFAVGSLDTLADRPNDPVREDLIRFYRQHYAAEKMSLVLLAPLPLEQLQTLARELFSDIPPRITAPAGAQQNQQPPAAQAHESQPPLFEPGTLPLQVNIRSIEDSPELSLSFPVPPIKDHYREKPLHYLSALIGHEGDGSLLQQLKAEGLAQSLSAGPNLDQDDVASLAINIGLTRKGFAEYQRVIDLSFQYLRMLRAAGPQQWYYEQEQLINDTDFRFQQSINPSYYVIRLASNLKQYPLADTIRGDYLYAQYNPALISDYLAKLTADNVLITLSDNKMPTTEQEPWYGTGYSLRSIPSAERQDWSTGRVSSSLQLPKPNPFLAEDLTLITGISTSVPAVIEQHPGYRLWYKLDQEFQQPRADFYFTFRSPVANNKPLNYVQTKLFVALVKDQLNSFIYPAHVAGFDVDLYNHVRGFSLRLSGFRDNQELLLERIADTLKTLSVDPDKLALYKQQLQRSLENRDKQKPYNQTLDKTYQQLLQPQWSEAQQLSALEKVSPLGLELFITELLAQADVEALAHGNLSRDDALMLSSVLQQKLLQDVDPVDVPAASVAQLQPGTRVIDLDINHQDSAITYYIQAKNASMQKRAEFGVLSEILSPLFYNELRTEQQRGYVVFLTPMPVLEQAGLAFVIQSPTTSAEQLQQHIRTFIARGADTLNQLDAATLERYKRSLLVKVMDKDQKLQERSNRYWQEIDRGHTQFNSREKLAAAIKAVDLEDLKTAYPELHRHQLVVRATGQPAVATQ